MKKGLVIGKFLPLHKGHIALIEFALQHCDYLTVLVCYFEKEIIPGEIRLEWLNESFARNERVTNIAFPYNDDELPNTSVSSKETALLWARAISGKIPLIDIVFSSETYGDFLAEYFNCEHLLFDQARKMFPIAASQIMKDPFLYWDFLANATRPFFVKKIAVAGTESTGKTTITEKLAKIFDAGFLHETAREIIEETEACIFEDLEVIASLQAKSILKRLKTANKLLFVDTELNITKSYSNFFFQKELVVDDWVEAANKFDLYLYLEKDCPFIQDGTRLNETERNKLDDSHRDQFEKAGIHVISINGTWEERLNKSVDIIKRNFKISQHELL